MVDFAKLKASSGKSALEKLTQEIQKAAAPQEGGADNRFWYPNVDKVGNGFAVIRFLSAPGDETVPFVRIWEHGFKGPAGQWYIEKSLTTLGKSDPVSELNSKLWNSTTDDESPLRKQVRIQKRKMVYITNILVIQDQANPENNGKVFLFKFGKKIWDKINEAMNPQFADESPMNPFDLWAGANFRLKIKNVSGYRNYDDSKFASSAPLFDDDSKLESVWKQEHSLQAFLDPSTFKSYDDLMARMNLVLQLGGEKPTPQQSRKAVLEKNSDIDDEIPWMEPAAQKQAPAKHVEEEDEDLAFFQKLTNKD